MLNDRLKEAGANSNTLYVCVMVIFIGGMVLALVLVELGVMLRSNSLWLIIPAFGSLVVAIAAFILGCIYT